MPKLTNITSATWPINGAATPASTGMDTVTGWTHTADGIITADGVGGTIAIDAGTVPFSAGATDYWVLLELVCETTGAALAADAATGSWFAIYGATTTRLDWYWRNIPQLRGFNYVPVMSIAGTNCNPEDQGGANAFPVIPVGKAMQLAFHLQVGVSGCVELYLNGSLLFARRSMDTTQIGSPANIRSLGLPNIAGTRWRMRSGSTYNGSVAMLPDWTRNEIDAPTAIAFKVFETGQNGSDWSTAGTATLAQTSFAGTGVQPSRSRAVVSGNALTLTGTTTRTIGSLPFNASGWCNINWMSLYVPTGTLSLSAGTAMAMSVHDAGLYFGATKIADWNPACRYCLIWHLASDGRAAWSLVDLTSDTNDVAYVWSGTLAGGWTPASVGAIAWTATPGVTAIEVDAVLVQRWTHIVGVDSLAHAMCYGLTPLMAVNNNVAQQLPRGTSQELIPGAAYPWQHIGFERAVQWPVIGRSGRMRSEMTTRAIAGMANSRAIVLVNIDGGSINDINQVNGSVPTARVATLDADLRTMCDTLIANGNKVWLSTMIRREQGTYTEQELQGINLFNNAIRTAAMVKQTASGQVWLSDIAAMIGEHDSQFTAGDDTHFNAAGNTLDAQYMVQYRTTPVATPPTTNRVASIRLGRRR